MKALFSLNDTTRAGEFAERLIGAGWDIVASSETVEILRGRGLPVQDIADFTEVRKDYGFPPTLHAKVEYALTADDEKIDLVYVIPYPLSNGNDVGGRTLLALAVKGGRIAVMSIEDMAMVVDEIVETGEFSEESRVELAGKASYEIAQHYLAVGGYDSLSGEFAYNLKNGENPYQVPAAAFRSEDGDALSLLNFKRVSGEAPCFTNMADADSILQTMCLAAEAFKLNTGSVPYICVAAKHGNACGMGVESRFSEIAIEKALWGNSGAIWGGEVITNFPIDVTLARWLLQSDTRKVLLGSSNWMLDVIMAPAFTKDAISILGKRKGRKLFVNEALSSPLLKKTGFTYRAVRGGFFRQPPASYVLDLNDFMSDGHVFSNDEIDSLIIAWAVAFSSSHGGNEIAITKNGRLLGVGGGPSTVEAAKIAVQRAQTHDMEGSVFAADAFFPFTDACSVLCDAGVIAGCVPSGGKHDADIKDYFQSRDVGMAYLPEEFRGFCRH